jgi:hypothetical protein
VYEEVIETWSPSRRDLFRQAYRTAFDLNHESFTFDGMQYSTEFAAEYLDWLDVILDGDVLH